MSATKSCSAVRIEQMHPIWRRAQVQVFSGGDGAPVPQDGHNL
jgi:hypothetical protein